MAYHSCEGCQVLPRRADLPVLQHATQNEVQARQMKRHDNLLFIEDFIEVAHVVEDRLKKVAILGSILVYTGCEVLETGV